MLNQPIIPIFKYGGLRDHINKLGRKKRVQVSNELCELLDIHNQTLKSWLKIKYDSNREIKEVYLKEIAEYFDVRVVELKSFVVDAPDVV